MSEKTLEKVMDKTNDESLIYSSQENGNNIEQEAIEPKETKISAFLKKAALNGSGSGIQVPDEDNVDPNGQKTLADILEENSSNNGSGKPKIINSPADVELKPKKARKKRGAKNSSITHMIPGNSVVRVCDKLVNMALGFILKIPADSIALEEEEIDILAPLLENVIAMQENKMSPEQLLLATYVIMKASSVIFAKSKSAKLR